MRTGTRKTYGCLNWIKMSIESVQQFYLGLNLGYQAEGSGEHVLCNLR